LRLSGVSRSTCSVISELRCLPGTLGRRACHGESFAGRPTRSAEEVNYPVKAAWRILNGKSTWEGSGESSRPRPIRTGAPEKCPRLSGTWIAYACCPAENETFSYQYGPTSLSGTVLACHAGARHRRDPSTGGVGHGHRRRTSEGSGAGSTTRFSSGAATMVATAISEPLAISCSTPVAVRSPSVSRRTGRVDLSSRFATKAMDRRCPAGAAGRLLDLGRLGVAYPASNG
jgi:hypothetical protein